MEIVGTQKLWTRANGNTYKKHCFKGHEFTPENTYINPKSQKRNCKTCNTERRKQKFLADPEGARHYFREHMTAWRAANPERDKKNWTTLRRQKKAWLDAYKSEHPCRECGESHSACLDFHHRDPKEKKANLSVAIAHWSIERLQMEVAKCDILCSNCHRKLHWQERLN